jgi:hypothetical protein
MSRNGRDLEQEFIVKPGGDLSRVHISYRGIKRLTIAKDGSLEIDTAFGKLHETQPRIYQKIDGKEFTVKGRFKLTSETSYGFEVGTHDTRYALVIDPTLLYSTYLGGSAAEEAANAVAVDASGNAYVAGYTLSNDFPVTTGAFETVHSGFSWAGFVSKLNATGSALVYSTYFTNTGPTGAIGIAVDGAGNAYVTGKADGSGLFPTTANAYSQNCLLVNQSRSSGFLSVLNPNGGSLLYSTCFGSLSQVSQSINGIAIDSNGHAFIVGYASSSEGVPITPNAVQTSVPESGNFSSAFVTGFDTRASGAASLFYSTYLGITSVPYKGSGVVGNAIAVDSFGKVYIAGGASQNLLVTPGAFQTSFNVGANCNSPGIGTWPCPHAFAAKLDPTAPVGQSLIYSTYLEGTSADVASGIAVDSSGNAYVIGSTQSWDFPVTSGSFQSVPVWTSPLGNVSESFIAKLNAAGSNLVYASFIEPQCSPPGQDCPLQTTSANGIAVDSLGNAYVTGAFRGFQINLPVTPDAFQKSYSKLNRESESFLMKVNPSGATLLYSSYFGGSGDDVATSVAVDQTGDAYIVGHTSSPNLPTLNPYQLTMKGTGDAFIAKFGTGAAGGLSITAVYPSQGGNNGAITPTIIGSGFHYGATVSLSCPSIANLAGTNPSVGPDGRTIAASFSLVAQAPGPCSVTVVNVDGTSATLPAAFTVVQGGSEDIQVDLFGSSHIVGGFATSYLAGYVNRGTVDSKPFRLWISFPNFFSWSPPPGITPASAGQLNGVIYVGFDIASVPAGTSGWIPIQLVAPSTPDFTHRPFTLQVWKEEK